MMDVPCDSMELLPREQLHRVESFDVLVQPHCANDTAHATAKQLTNFTDAVTNRRRGARSRENHTVGLVGLRVTKVV